MQASVGKKKKDCRGLIFAVHCIDWPEILAQFNLTFPKKRVKLRISLSYTIYNSITVTSKPSKGTDHIPSSLLPRAKRQMMFER